jgi:hypothetical protein
VQATQPKAWETLVKNHGEQAGETLLARLRDQLDRSGTLGVLRHGIELLGLRQPLKLAEFKPALAINADILARYATNRLAVGVTVHRNCRLRGQWPPEVERWRSARTAKYEPQRRHTAAAALDTNPIDRQTFRQRARRPPNKNVFNFGSGRTVERPGASVVEVDSDCSVPSCIMLVKCSLADMPIWDADRIGFSVLFQTNP